LGHRNIGITCALFNVKKKMFMDGWRVVLLLENGFPNAFAVSTRCCEGSSPQWSEQMEITACLRFFVDILIFYGGRIMNLSKLSRCVMCIYQAEFEYDARYLSGFWAS
jgi:hypothetical protein